MRISLSLLAPVARAMEPEAEVFCSTALRTLLLLHDKSEPIKTASSKLDQPQGASTKTRLRNGRMGQSLIVSQFLNRRNSKIGSGGSTERELLTLSLLSPLLTQRLQEARKSRTGGGVSTVKSVDVMDRKYLDHIESCVIQNAQKRHKTMRARNVDLDPCFQLFPFVTHTPVTSAATLASMICRLIERDIHFRRIWPQVETMYNQAQSIRGIRVSCAGRTSRKATKAKTLNARAGSTSLAVFSRDVDYAAATADTRHGSIGIKVWIAFK